MPRAQIRALPSALRADEAVLLTAGRMIAALIWNEISTLGSIKGDYLLLLLTFADCTASADSACNMDVVHHYGDDGSGDCARTLEGMERCYRWRALYAVVM